jgi:hypothetical protein
LFVNFELAEGIEILERTPAAFRALLAGLSDPWLHTNEGAQTFTVFDNLAHVIHGERTDWIPRAKVILAQGANRRFDPFDRFAHEAESAGKSLDTLLGEFETLRAANLATLRSWSLTNEHLELVGEHPAFGQVTLRQLLATWVAHDLGHIAQTARVMAKRYREDVGPWRAYLPIMDRP